MVARLSRWIAVVVFLVPVLARAQGLLVVVDPAEHVRLPRPIIIWPPHPYPHPIPQPEPPPVSYKIDALEVDARVTDQVAKVQVSQSFVNTGSRQMEVAFIFPLPYDGAIDRMTLLVDGKEMPAKLLSADDARRTYEEIVRKNRDPALLEWIGTGMFKTSVFPVPPGAKRTVSLRYVQLCRKQEGMTDFLFPLSTAKYTSQPVEKINFRVSVESQEDIKNIYSPTHAVEIKRPDDRHAVVSYTAKDQVPASDFRLLYDIGRGKVSMRVLTYRPDKDQDGYFLLLASPEIKAGSERPKKTVLLVMDRSGSMSGQKIEQVRAALKHVLNNLREGDLFNVIAFDSEVESFRPELQRYNDKTRREALGFAEGLYAGGSTNINEALRISLGQLTDAGRPSYVVFLTDGLPTVGETNEMRIVANSKEFNKVHARIFCFGVGYDLNARFLDKLVRENFGQSEYVRPDENIEEHVARLYNRIESPVLTGMKMRYDFDTVEDGRRLARQPRLSARGGRSVCRRSVGRRRALQEGGHGQGGRDGPDRRQGGEVRLPRHVRREEQRRIVGLHREAVGRPPRGRDPRPDGPQRQERRVGEGTGRIGHAARHPHAVHVVHGRRDDQHPRPDLELRPRQPAAGIAGPDRRRGGHRAAGDEGRFPERL